MTKNSKKSWSTKKDPDPPPQHSTFKQLKMKFESNSSAALEIRAPSPQLFHLKTLKKSKVKQIVSIYNSRLCSQDKKPEIDTDDYFNSADDFSANSDSELESYLPKSNPIRKICHNKKETPARIASPRMSDVNFATLTFKQKVQLYTEFISELFKNKLVFDAKAEVIKTNIKRNETTGEVVYEKQESVKHLVEKIENRCVYNRLNVTPLSSEEQKNEMTKKGVNNLTIPARGATKPKEFKNLCKKSVSSYISTLTITLSPYNTEAEETNGRGCKTLPHDIKHQAKASKKYPTIEACHKRKYSEMHSPLSIETNAPPKKIRRTRTEKLKSRMIFQNLQLKNLLFTWLSERRLNIEEKNEPDVKANGDDKSIEKLLAEAIAKFKNLQFEDDKSTKMATKKAKTKAKRMSKIVSRKKRTTSPVPVNKCKTTTSTCQVTTFTLEQSEPGLAHLPKITSDESPPPADVSAKESDHSEKDTELKNSFKSLRKKKLRQTVADWMKYESCEKLQNSTDSDNDKNLNPLLNSREEKNNTMICLRPEDIEIENCATVETTAELNSVECDTTNLDVCTPTKETAKQEENTHSRPSAICNKFGRKLFMTSSLEIKGDGCGGPPNIRSRSQTDSFIDQGFETGSNEFDSPVRVVAKSCNNNNKSQAAAAAAAAAGELESPPLYSEFCSEFQSIATEVENSSCCSSTPIKKDLQKTNDSTTSQHQERVSPPTLALTQRRSSFTMQLIRKHQKWQNNEITPAFTSNNADYVFFGKAPSTHETSNDRNIQFWIETGDFSLKFDVHFNYPERIQLRQTAIFSKDFHFGIDSQKFSQHHIYDHDNIFQCLPPASKEHSYYWFSNGHIGIACTGKFLSADKITRFFQFIKTSVEETGILRFGLDAIEFSNTCAFSNYNMLVGLQSGNINGLEGRNKLNWPQARAIKGAGDFYRNCYGCENFEEHDSYRLSFSPFFGDDYNLLRWYTEGLIKLKSIGVSHENEASDNDTSR